MMAATMWPTLREFLDAGGDLFDEPNVETGEWLMVVLYQEVAGLPEWARHWRAEDVRRTSVGMMDAWDERAERSSDDVGSALERTWGWMLNARRISWEADLIEDPELVERVRALLSPEQRAEVDMYVDCYRRPYPLTVETPPLAYGDWWNCSACGAAFGRDVEAIVVGDRMYDDGHHHTKLEQPIPYCRSCVAAALAAYDGILS